MIIDPGGPSQNKGNLSSATSSQKAKAAVVTTPSTVAASPKPLPSPTADSVSLSARAQTLSKLEAKIGQAPDVDRGKVESIKQSIAEGRYKIDPNKIAAAILADEGYPH